jgi:hypothetical protein
MFSSKLSYLSASLLFAALLVSPAARAQAPSNCVASQATAVECFIAHGVTTKLTPLRHGMTLAQYQAYGVAVSHILETDHTYLVLVGLSSAIADAMPPTNSTGATNTAAQTTAVNAIVSAAVTNNLAGVSTGVTTEDLEYFSQDVVTAMNTNNNYLALLTPGVSLRMIDSYIVSSTTNGTVNWTEVNSGLTSAIQNFITSGLIKLPAGLTQTELVAFAESVAKAIYAYKQSTARTSL